MGLHEKGRVLKNSKNKPMIFLGIYLTVCAAFICYCKRFVNLSCCSCCGFGAKKEE